jgi:hypothetical protein
MGRHARSSLAEQVWHHFGGSAACVATDNRKEGVFKPDLNEPVFNGLVAATLALLEEAGGGERVRAPNRAGSVDTAIGRTQVTALKDWLVHALQAGASNPPKCGTRSSSTRWIKWAASSNPESECHAVKSTFDYEQACVHPLFQTGIEDFSERGTTHRL